MKKVKQTIFLALLIVFLNTSAQQTLPIVFADYDSTTKYMEWGEKPLC